MFALEDCKHSQESGGAGMSPGEFVSRPDEARAGQNGGRSMAACFDWLRADGFPKYGTYSASTVLINDHGRAMPSEPDPCSRLQLLFSVIIPIKDIGIDLR